MFAHLVQAEVMVQTLTSSDLVYPCVYFSQGGCVVHIVGFVLMVTATPPQSTRLVHPEQRQAAELTDH